MLDRVLRKAMEGFTVIEEESGGVGRILARQLGGYARAAGKRVVFMSLTVDEASAAPRMVVNPGVTEMQGGLGGASPTYGRSQNPPFLDGGNYDLLIVDALSNYLYERTEKEGVEVVRAIVRMARQGKNFIVTYDRALLGEKTSAFLRAAADTVVVVKTDLIGERVNRMLYVPKMKDTVPMDRLVKITVDEGGVQVDTREFVG